MKNHLFSAVLAALLLAPAAFASDEDLKLPGEKWLAQFDKYICAAFGPAVERPEGFEELGVEFLQMTTDSTLDNGLLKATFEEDGVQCRYSALLFADNAASTIRLVESKAFAPTSTTKCEVGRERIDQALEMNDYLYYGHPHNLAIMAPIVGAGHVCGPNAKLIGINFVVKGRI